MEKRTVQELIAHRILPLVALDGGDIELVSVDADKGTVSLRFGGAYRGSPCRGVVSAFVVAPILKEAFDTDVSVDFVD